MKEQTKTKGKAERKAALFAWIPFAMMLPVSAAAAVFYHRSGWFGAALLLLSAFDLFTSFRRHRRPLRLFSGGVLLLLGGFVLFIRAYFPVLILFTLSFLAAVGLLFWETARTKKEKPAKRRFLQPLAAGFCTVVFLLPLALGWFPDPLFRYVMQEGVMDHVAAPAETLRADGVREIVDLTYPSSAPNNTMSLFLAPENRGTLFFIHGGGFVLGDKEAMRGPYFERWVREGYNVVSFDYALAPQFRVEKQLVQCGEALLYFMQHAEDWGVDRERIILVGESAGGCLSGLLAAAGTSDAIAACLGLPAPAQYGAAIRGWISVGGLVDVPQFGDTDDDLASWAFNLMGICAFHNPAYAASQTARLFSVTAQATAAFPPAYLSDGNHGTFTAQGVALAEKLQRLGVRVESNFVPTEAGRRTHVFELHPDTDPLAAENFEKTLAFVRSVLN